MIVAVGVVPVVGNGVMIVAVVLVLVRGVMMIGMLVVVVHVVVHGGDVGAFSRSVRVQLIVPECAQRAGGQVAGEDQEGEGTMSGA